MTPQELNNLTFGVSPNNGCSGVSGSAPRLNFSGFCLSDAGNGLRGTDLVTGFASGVSVAASWNIDLAYQRALYMGAEFKRKGAHIINGPVVGPLGRIALDGRAWVCQLAERPLCSSRIGRDVENSTDEDIRRASAPTPTWQAALLMSLLLGCSNRSSQR